MTEILLKMALDTINQQTNQPNINKTINDFHLESQTIKRTKKYRFGNPVLVLGLVRDEIGLRDSTFCRISRSPSTRQISGNENKCIHF
jgi:hypothetical protein